ncbi:MAG: hypothetical protein ACXVAN_17810, partial [Polyangia bacterium]
GMSREREEKAQREKLGMEPTVPATEVKSGLPDFASERSMSDGGRGGATAWVVVFLVVAVAGLFWWLSPGAPKSASPAPSPPSPAATSPAATKPIATKPAATKPAAPVPVPTPVPPAPAPSSPAPRAAPESPSVVAEKPSAPPPRKHRRRHHKKASAKAKEVKLPRLPSPPPAD